MVVPKISGGGYSTLTKWLKDFRESGDIPVRGSGNYASDEQKEIARLKRELRDAQDALDVLKKSYQHSGKITEAFISRFLKRRKLPENRIAGSPSPEC